MIDFEIQGVVYQALSSIAGGNVFDRVPAKQPLPYLYIGQDEFSADYDSADLTECTIEVHAFASTRDDVKLLAGQIRTALDKKLIIPGHLVYEWSYEDTRYFTDPDGLTEHAALSFRYLVGATE
jgi:hypothetical protein